MLEYIFPANRSFLASKPSIVILLVFYSFCSFKCHRFQETQKGNKKPKKKQKNAKTVFLYLHFRLFDSRSKDVASVAAFSHAFALRVCENHPQKACLGKRLCWFCSQLSHSRFDVVPGRFVPISFSKSLGSKKYFSFWISNLCPCFKRIPPISPGILRPWRPSTSPSTVISGKKNLSLRQKHNTKEDIKHQRISPFASLSQVWAAPALFFLFYSDCLSVWLWLWLFAGTLALFHYRGARWISYFLRTYTYPRWFPSSTRI